MAVPTLPIDTQNPWGQIIRDAIIDTSNRADSGITKANAAQAELDTVHDTVDDQGLDIANHNTRIGTLESSNATKAADNAVVKLTGNQTVAGTKTFSSALVVPDNSFSIAKVSGLQTVLNQKATSANPTFSGTITGINGADIGLGNVDNTSDVNKPISSAAQAALNLKASTSDLNSIIATHNHTGGANGPAIPITAVSGLQSALNGKQNPVITAAGSSTTFDTSAWTINYFHIRRHGATCYVSMKFTSKKQINETASGNIPNLLIGTIQSASQFYDVYQGSSNDSQDSMLYALSSTGEGTVAVGYLQASSRQFVLTATVPGVTFGVGYTFSLAGSFLLNTDS